MSAPTDTAARLVELGQLLGQLPEAALPLALLPAHLETRFVQREGGDELLVRIRPDTLWVDAHEPELTARELEWGRTYWQHVWRAADDEVRRAAAWSQLAGQFGDERAAWVARSLAPENLDERPAAPPADGVAPPAEPRFPSPPQKDASWTQPAVIRGEPGRWVVLGYRGGRRVLVAWGEPVAEKLAVTPTPDAAADMLTFADDELAIEERLRWLVDFAEAERVGMGIRMPLRAGEAQQGFDTLLALGVRTEAEPERLLTELLTVQAYTDGLAFVPRGTPTNNTEAGAAGFSSAHRDFEPSAVSGRTLADASNAALAAAALGVERDVFLDAPDADSTDDRDAEAMNIALWPATGGYFAEQFLEGVVEPPDARDHFVRHVRAGGPLPLLRIGRQPYGLLPTIALDLMRPSDAAEAAFVGWLRTLRTSWRTALPKAPRATPGTDPDRAAQTVLDTLRLDFASVGFQARLIFDQALFGSPQVPFSGATPPAPALAHRRALETALQAHGVVARPRLLDVFPSAPPFPLEPQLTENGAAAQAESHVLDWLRTASFTALRDEVYRPALDLPDRSLNSLLYLTLRHAVLLAYGLAAHRLLVASGALAGPYREPALVDVVGGTVPQRTDTVLRLLERTAPAASDRPLAEVIHTLGAAQHAEAAELDELRDALAHLATLPAATLERELRGTLDLFAYRLDAWITSLATRRLAELRRARPRGVALGGYGWVENLRPARRTPVTAAPPGEDGGPLFGDPASGGVLHAPSLSQATAGAILRSGFLSQQGEGGSRPLAVDVTSTRARLALGLLDGVREGQPFPALLGYRFERGLHDRGLDRHIARFRRLAPFGELNEARVAREDAERELRRMQALPHPELVAARARVDQLQRKIASLSSERSSLPGRLQAAEAELARISAQLQDVSRRAGELELRLERAGQPPSQQLERFWDQVETLSRQRTTQQGQVDGLRRRRTTIGPEIDRAKLDLKDAERRATELARLPHPGVAAARAAFDAADARFRSLLEAYRARYLFPRTKDLRALESLAEVDVVDGWKLLQLWRDGRVPWERLDVGPDRAALEAELTTLADAVDAVGDVLTLESVLQLAQGNAQRAGATLDAVVHGDVPPPQVESLETPQSGLGVTHRLMLLFAGQPPATPEWPADERHARARAEPYLNAWAARLLGDPARVRCRVEHLDPDTGRPLATRDVRLAELGLSPLDVVYAGPGSIEGALAELELLVRVHAESSAPDGVLAGAPVRVEVERGEDWSTAELGLVELAEVAGAMRRVLDGGRFVAGGDLAHPASAAAAAPGLLELRARADTAAKALRAAREQLERADDPAGRLRVCWHLGVPDAIPDRERLPEQAAAAVRELRRREAALKELEEAFVRRGAPPEQTRDHDLRRLELVFGGVLRVLPRVRPENAAELDAGFAAQEELLGGEPLALRTWLERVACVRPAVADFHDALVYAAALDVQGADRLLVCQLPRAAGEPWVGLDGGRPAEGRVSIVTAAPLAAEVRTNRLLAGLLVDEWTEVVPDARQVTGAAFHFDAPAAEAPQAVLLAVAPGGDERWSLEAVEATLLETLELAKLRAVDPAALTDGGLTRALPALWFGLNLAGDTVSTDFKRPR